MTGTRSKAKQSSSTVSPPINQNGERKILSPIMSEPHYSKLSEEGKTLLALITAKFEEVIKIKEEKIFFLESQVSIMSEEMKKLNSRIDDIESEQRSSTVIISGSKVPSVIHGEDTSRVACDLIKRELKYELHPDKVSIAYRIGKKPNTQSPDNRNILLKVRSRDDKQDLFNACKSFKPPNIFMNESLIPKRAKVLYYIRQAKRQFPDKIAACGSSGGRVFVYVKSSNPADRNNRMVINDIDELDAWAMRIIGKKLSEESQVEM